MIKKIEIMKKKLKRWLPIMESLQIKSDDKLEKLCEYAEIHANVDAVRSLYAGDIHITRLPISLMILKELDNFEITNNIDDVDTIQTKIKLESVDGMLPMNPEPHYESEIRTAMVNELKDKNILVYQLISEIKKDPDYFDKKIGTLFKCFNVISDIKINKLL